VFRRLCTGKGEVDFMSLVNGKLETNVGPLRPSPQSRRLACRAASRAARPQRADTPPRALQVAPSPAYFIAYQIVCGLYYYTYNEMAFAVLDLLDPVGQAVGNTVKRVIIIIAGTIVFNKPLTTNGMIGSAVAIGGVLLYSLVKAGGGKPADKSKKA
jgi:hypothetical protein